MREGGKDLGRERKRLYITVADVFGSWKKVIIILNFSYSLGQISSALTTQQG